MLIALKILKPYKGFFKNKLEIFNEICILAACYSLVPFLDEFSFNYISNTQIVLGYFPIMISLLFLIANLLFIAVSQFTRTKKKVIHLYSKLKTFLFKETTHKIKPSISEGPNIQFKEETLKSIEDNVSI